MKIRLGNARDGRNTESCSNETTLHGAARFGRLAFVGAAAIAMALASSANAQYCTATTTNCNPGPGLDEAITRVQFGTIDNSSASGSGCYSDYTAMTANVNTGGVYMLTVTNANGYAPDDQCSAWFDWNHNNVFDAGEQVNLVGDANQVVFTANVTVPANAMAGATRMRVRLAYDDVPMSACGAATYGETEDYSVFVTVLTTGACCNGTACTVTNNQSCAGTFRGASTSCSPNICQGACCDTLGNCTITAFNACSGPFVSAGVCSPNPCSYCTASATYCANSAADERISQFEFNDIINPASPDTGAAPTGCYTDWTAVGTTVFPGQTYNVALHNPAPYAADQAAVWIDFNHDFQFGDVASGEETILTIGSDNGGATGSLFTGSVTIPANATVGTTRLRVRIVYAATPAACGTATYGETEDYSITIQAPTVGACCAAGNGTCSTTTQAGCASGFQGLATSCAPSNPCGGACCDAGGNCTLVASAGTCTGTYVDHAACNATVCAGSCCDAGGICTLQISSACTGTFGGLGSSCNPSPCPGQSCASPIPLMLDQHVNGDLSASTTNSTITCSSGIKGLWYTFTAPADGGYAIVSFNTGANGAGNPSLGVFMPCGNQVACDNPCTGTMSTVLQTLNAGDTIVFRAGGCGDGQLAWDVSVTTAILGACCNDTTGACTTTGTGSAGCAAGTTYQGDNTACDSVPSVLCGAGPCCNDTTGACTVTTQAGCTFTWQNIAGTSCSPNPCPQPPPPDNDDCSTVQGSTTLPVITDAGGTFPCDLSGSTNDGTACIANLSRDVYFSFTPTTTGNWGFSTCTGSDAIDTVLSVHTGCPTSTANQVACNDDNCGLLSNLPIVGLSAGTQYIVRVALYSAAGTQGFATLTVVPVTAGACCDDSTGACTATTTGSCATGTYQGDNSVCDAVPSVLCGAGPCCNAGTGVCTVTTQAGCAFDWQSQVGTACTTTFCPQPPTGACCDNTTGACTEVFPGNCNASTSSYSGDNTTCDPSGFCPGIGTCCSSLGTCTVRYIPTCPTGLTDNASTTCTPGLCPVTGTATCQNFDADATGTLPAGWSSTVPVGTGAPWVIDSTQFNSASNAVATNDIGSVSSQILELPAVIAGNSGALTLDFVSYFDTEPTFDGFVVEYSTDGGGTWTDVVVGGTWVLNGYNQAAISTAFGSPIAGRPAFSGVFTSWTEHIATIPANPGDSVIFHFWMASDDSVAHTGVWLDDICIGGVAGGGGGGVCCRGATCNTSITSAGACSSSLNGALAGAVFASSASCNSGGSTTTPCCYPDYNKVNGVGVPDIFDFLNDWFAGKLFANVGGDGNSGTLAVQNIFDFLNAWFAGGCTP
jgi:hypothetical protein